jgi:unsaturated rhamnogalacturonyl hydrolase
MGSPRPRQPITGTLSGRFPIPARLFALVMAVEVCCAQISSPAVAPPPAGDAPLNPGPLSHLSAGLSRGAICNAMRKVADWQLARLPAKPSEDWTFAALYTGMLAASDTLEDPRYRHVVEQAGETFEWQLGPRQTHADDQAIGQSYLALYRRAPDPRKIAPLQAQFDRVLLLPDDSAKPVWWWSDALFMAPPVWSGLAQLTHQPKYLDYMDRQWWITVGLLYDPAEHLFSRDATFLDRHEANGKKIFWSRGNGWVMGGIVRVLETMPLDHPARPRYEALYRDMAEKIRSIQSDDGLWRPGLLDARAYPLPETSGSAFFTYALAWGIHHHLLNRKRFSPVVARAWKGLLAHVYEDGRLGCIQPVGASPDAYQASSSYVYGVGAFLLAGSELAQLSRGR